MKRRKEYILHPQLTILGLILTSKSRALSPTFDINPVPGSTGLHLNITEHSNALELELAREVAE